MWLTTGLLFGLIELLFQSSINHVGKTTFLRSRNGRGIKFSSIDNDGIFWVSRYRISRREDDEKTGENEEKAEPSHWHCGVRERENVVRVLERGIRVPKCTLLEVIQSTLRSFTFTFCANTGRERAGEAGGGWVSLGVQESVLLSFSDQKNGLVGTNKKWYN